MTIIEKYKDNNANSAERKKPRPLICAVRLM